MRDDWRYKLNYFLSADFLYAAFKVVLVFAALGLIQYGVYVKVFGVQKKATQNKNTSKSALGALLDQAMQKEDFSQVDQYTLNQKQRREDIINTFGGRRRIASLGVSCEQKIDMLEARIENLESALRRQNRDY